MNDGRIYSITWDSNYFAGIEDMETLYQKAKKALNNKSFIIRYEIIRYSPKTGKPEQYAWRPYETWDGTLWVTNKYADNHIDPEDPTNLLLMKIVPCIYKDMVIVPYRGERGYDINRKKKNYQSNYLFYICNQIG